MDTVTILRALWRRRFLVLGVYVVALLAGTAVMYKFSPPLNLESRKYEVGVATTSILIDTPSSQVVEIAPKGSDTLGVRANLLASLMVDGVLKSEIARSAGLDPEKLVGISTSVEGSSAAQPTNRNAPVLTTRVVTDNDGSELPIIQVEAQATNAATAARLANAAVTGLRDYLDSKAAAQRIPNVQRLQVTSLGVPQARTVARGPKNIFALAAVLFVFGLGCAGILSVSALMRGWRDAAAEEEDDRSDDNQRPGPRAVADPAEAAGSTPGDSWLSAPHRPSLVVAQSPEPERIPERPRRRVRSA
jgi:hypothetical protein